MKDKANMIPNEVVGAIVKMDKTPLQAWREYFQISEQELSVRLGISEMELVKMEKQPNHKKSSLKIFAATLGLNVEQLNI